MLALLLTLLAPARAHSPDLAAWELEELDGGWVLSMHLPQVAVQRALEERLGIEVVAGLGEVALKEAVVAYVKATVRLETTEGAPLPLGGGGIRLGAHQTDLRLSVAPPPPTAEALQVELRAFTEDGHHAHVLRVRRGGVERAREVLDADDDWTARVPLAP